MRDIRIVGIVVLLSLALVISAASAVSVTILPNQIAKGDQVTITFQDLPDNADLCINLTSALRVDPGTNFTFQATNFIMPFSLNSGTISAKIKDSLYNSVMVKKGDTTVIWEGASVDGNFSRQESRDISSGIYDYMKLDGSAAANTSVVFTTLNFCGKKQGPSNSAISFTMSQISRGAVIVGIQVNGTLIALKEIPVVDPTPTVTPTVTVTPTIIPTGQILSIQNASIPVGGTVLLPIMLDTAPKGVSGYNMSVALSNPNAGKIVGISFPDCIQLRSNSSVPADSVWMTAVDLNNCWKPGDKNIVLGSVLVRGDSNTTSLITPIVIKMDDDTGNPIVPSIKSGILTIGDVGGDKGYYAITSDPSGADVTFDGIYRGKSPVTVDVYTAGTPGHTVLVSMTGYQSSSVTLAGNPLKDQTIPVFVKLNPIITPTPTQTPTNLVANFTGSPVTGTAPLTSVFSDTSTGSPVRWEWNFGDGSINSTTMNPTHTFTTMGVYSVALTVWNGANQTNTKFVKDMVTVQQVPPDKKGAIMTDSMPRGAVVSVDGIAMGQTPSVIAVPIGLHTVTFSMQGYQDFQIMAMVKLGQITRIPLVVLKLGPAIPPSQGSVLVRSMPTGAEVYLDGILKGRTPYLIPNVQPGMHTVKVALSDFIFKEYPVRVNAGKVTRLGLVILYPE